MKKLCFILITCLFVRIIDVYGLDCQKLNNEREDTIKHIGLNSNVEQCFANYTHIDSTANCNKFSGSFMETDGEGSHDSLIISNNRAQLSIIKSRPIEGVSIEMLLEGDVIGITNKNQISEVDQAECVWFRDGIEIARGEKVLFIGNPIVQGLYKAELYHDGNLLYEIERLVVSEQSLVKPYPSKVHTNEPFTIKSGKFTTCKVYSIEGIPMEITYHIEADHLGINGISKKGCYLIVVVSESGDLSKMKVWVVE